MTPLQNSLLVSLVPYNKPKVTKPIPLFYLACSHFPIQPNADKTTCESCTSLEDSFYYSSDGVACIRCEPGQEPNAQRTSCVACDIQYSPDGRECLTCDPGKQPSAIQGSFALTECQECGPGSISDGTGCTAREPGTQPNAGKTT